MGRPTLPDLQAFSSTARNIDMKMPVLFIGHGSPMNAIADNRYSRSLRELGRSLPKPRAILCISAHWMSEGTWITHQAKPRTIHDFYGFPQALFEVQYPAPGAPELAESIVQRIQEPRINLDDEQWGFDHGAWSVLRHLYPNADIPLLQLSLYMERPGSYHFQAGQALRPLRDEGILIVGSGNLVHNLRMIRWEEDAEPFPWATGFDEWFKARVDEGDSSALIQPQHPDARLAIPTWEHYYPLLYTLGAAEFGEKAHYLYEGVENGSISMRSFAFGI